MPSIDFTKMCSECGHSFVEPHKNKWNKQEGIAIMCSCEEVLINPKIPKGTTKIVCATARLDEDLCGRSGRCWVEKKGEPQ